MHGGKYQNAGKAAGDPTRTSDLPTNRPAFDLNLDRLIWQATKNFKGGRSFLYLDDVSILQRSGASLDGDAAGT